MTAGETARTLVIFRDCHARNNITVQRTAAGGENFPQKDCGNEKTTIFAAPYITKSGETASETRADFLFPPTPIRCSTPSPSVNAPAALRECKAEGKAAPLFLPRPQQKTSEMPYTEKDCASANKSNGCAAQAVQNAARRTLVIFRDCHARNNITVPLTDSYVERFYRNFARRMGWPCCIRRSEAQLRNFQRPPAGRKPRPKAPESGAGYHEAAMRFVQSLDLAAKGGAL